MGPPKKQTSPRKRGLQGAVRPISVGLIFADTALETERADWIAGELQKRKMNLTRHRYGPEDDLLSLMREVQRNVQKIIVLFSKRTTAKAGEAFSTIWIEGHKPIPVRVEACPKYTLLRDLAFADIFGNQLAEDCLEVDRMVRAIYS